MATFWRTFHHDGKISPAWWEWWVHAQPIHYIYRDVQSCGVSSSCEGRNTPPSSTLPIYVLCTWYSRATSDPRKPLSLRKEKEMKTQSQIFFAIGPWNTPTLFFSCGFVTARKQLIKKTTLPSCFAYKPCYNLICFQKKWKTSVSISLFNYLCYYKWSLLF